MTNHGIAVSPRADHNFVVSKQQTGGSGYPYACRLANTVIPILTTLYKSVSQLRCPGTARRRRDNESQSDTCGTACGGSAWVGGHPLRALDSRFAEGSLLILWIS